MGRHELKKHAKTKHMNRLRLAYIQKMDNDDWSIGDLLRSEGMLPEVNDLNYKKAEG